MLWILRVVLMLFLLQSSSLPFGSDFTAVSLIVKDHLFDYVTWEINALSAKVGETLWGVHPFLDPAAGSDLVRTYFADIAHARDLEAQINTVYAQADSDQAAAITAADLIAERDALRADLAARQTLIEAILEGQVASVLIDQGFGTAGQLLPPIAMRFTQVPNLLIVSPRDQIRFDISINLNPLPVDQMVALEAQIDHERDLSSLIVPLGGIALYPAMILETSSLPFAVETFAHEWLHHYLFAFPLGLSYDFAGEARIINETTASVFGETIGPLVLARYYPEFAPQARLPQPAFTLARWSGLAFPAVPQAVPFDFGRALNNTRIHVDELLAQGSVEEAEAYMEQRRRLFVANGYALRKLNQAYFAFYGGYQSDVQGAGGTDPIGPAVRDLLARSPSIQAWIVTLRGITTREELLAAVGG
ncbi:MAG: hypothetical protein U0670_03925 [Anaerolineae bacterium]